MKKMLSLFIMLLWGISLSAQIDTEYQVYPLTIGPFYDNHPAWSPDGKTIAFASDRNGFQQIFTLEMGSQAITQITQSEAHNSNPSWHPDGNQIIFDSDISGKKQIYIKSLNSANNRQFFKREVEAHTGRLNANSNLLVFVGKVPYEKQWNIYSYDFKYNNLNKITHHESDCFLPRWSPDAAYISYFNLTDHNSYKPAIIHWYGKKTFESAFDQPNIHDINWSPDGYKIVYVVKDDDLYQIYISRRDGSEKSRIATSKHSLSQPDWSPCGDAIVFCVETDYRHQNLWLLELH